MQLYLQIDRGIAAANLDTRAQLVTKDIGRQGRQALRELRAWRHLRVPSEPGRGPSPPPASAASRSAGRSGLLIVMAGLYVVGTSINPRFFGDLTALQSVLRDAARYGVMAVGMTFVIVNRDLDLSVGSTLGLVAVVFSIAFAPTAFDLPAWAGGADLPRASGSRSG